MDIQLPEKPVFYQVVNGYNFYAGFPAENIKSGLSYQPKSDDIFIVTYPKCGTTWMQQICVLLFNDGQIPEILKTEPLYVLSPFLESNGASAVLSMPKPGAIKSHLPFELMPFSSEAKYLHVLRNPKDACVSFYHHTNMFKRYQFDGTFTDYLKCWLLGEVDSGSYADHLLSWWPHRNDSNVMFVLYEEMKQDLRTVVEKIAKFIDPQYKERLQKNPNYLDDVVANSDVSVMKAITNPTHELRAKRCGSISENTKFEFIRKGVIGDWKNLFSEEDEKLMCNWFHSKFDGTGIEHLWDQFGIKF